MKKIFSILMIMLMVLAAGCVTESQSGSISKVDIRFKEEIVTIEDKKVVEELYENFQKRKEKGMENSKVWVYGLVFYTEDGSVDSRLDIVEDNVIRYDDIVYTVDGYELEYFDEITGINRERITDGNELFNNLDIEAEGGRYERIYSGRYT